MTQTITPSLRDLRTRPIPGTTAGATGIPSCAPPGHPTATAKPKLLDQVREAIRTRHYSYRTEEAYVAWIRRYILFHGKRHPGEMGKEEVTAFLTALAVRRNGAASTQNQALAAILRPASARHSSQGLASVIRAQKCGFFDAANVTSSSMVEGVHLDADQHAALGHALATVVGSLL